jgi:uncharacterized membrane-anchored protein YitT (DUF2179 family)
MEWACIQKQGFTGGIDIVAVIVKKYFSMNLWKDFINNHFVIIAIASFFFGTGPAMYTLVSMYVASTVLDKVQQGFGSSKSVRIITDSESRLRCNTKNS